MRRHWAVVLLLLILWFLLMQESKGQSVDSMQVVDVDSVSVQGKSRRVLLRESGLSVQSVDLHEVSIVTRELSDNLRALSGLGLQQQGGVGSNVEISLNGLKGSAVRYFIDGVPSHASTAASFLAQLPLGVVDHIEVYKGVVPPQFGGDALGGVVNVVTRQGVRNYLDVALSGGSFYTGQAEAIGQYVWRKPGIVVKGWLGGNYSRNSYIMRQVEVWDADSHRYEKRNLPRFHDRYLALSGGGAFGWHNRPWCDEALLEVTYSNTHSQVQTGMVQTVVVGQAKRARQMWSVSARYSKQDLLLKGLRLGAYVGYRSSSYTLTDTSCRTYGWDGAYLDGYFTEVLGRTSAIRHTDRPSLFGQLNSSYAWGNQHELSLNYAIDYQGNHRYDTHDSTFTPTHDAMRTHFIGLSYGLSLFEQRWYSLLFVKEYLLAMEIEQEDFSWLTESDEVPHRQLHSLLGYGGSMRYTFRPELALKASYEHSVRMPSARELLGNGATIYPHFTLKPEQAHNVNLGLYGTFTLGAGHRLEYEVGGFYRQVQDLIRLTIHTDRQLRYENIAAARIVGGEFDVRYHWGTQLTLALNGTLLDERNRNRTLSTGVPDITFNNRIPNRPFYYGHLEATYRFWQPFGLEGQSIRLATSEHYVHWYYFSWEAYGLQSTKAVIPTQWVTDCSVAWSFAHGRYTLSAECTNLFNALVYDNYLLQRPGRGLYGKFRMSIH